MIETKPKAARDGYYTVRQAAKLLEVSTGTIYNYIREGLLTARVRKATATRVISGAELIRVWETFF